MAYTVKFLKDEDIEFDNSFDDIDEAIKHSGKLVADLGYTKAEVLELDEDENESLIYHISWDKDAKDFYIEDYSNNELDNSNMDIN